MLFAVGSIKVALRFDVDFLRHAPRADIVAERSGWENSSTAQWTSQVVGVQKDEKNES